MPNAIKKYYPYLKNSGLYFISSIVTAFIGILLNPIYAMNLSHEDYAIIGYYSSFNLLLTPLLHFSLFSYYNRNYYFTKEEKREALGNTILLGSLIIGFVSLILFTVAFYAVYKGTNVQFPFFPYAILTFLQLYEANITSFYLIRLRLTKKAKQFSKVTIMQCIIIALLSLLLVVYYKYGAAGKLYGTLFASILMSVYSLKKLNVKFSIDKDILIISIKFGAPLTLSAILWYFLSGFDRFLIEKLNDSYTLGLYSVGLMIASYMGIFYTTISNTFEPDIYRTIAEKNTKKLFYIIATIIGVVAFFNLLFIVLAPFIIDLLTAGRYNDSCIYAQILAIHNISMACYYMVVKLFIGYSYVKEELYVRITGAVVSIILFYILINNFGFIGAAWGQVASFTVLSIIGILAFIIKKKNRSTI